MSEEEKKVIENFSNFIKSKEKEQEFLYENEEYYKDDIEQNELFLKMLRSVLNLINKQQKENVKKDKIINNMSNYIYNVDYRSECGNTREQVKQYFENKKIVARHFGELKKQIMGRKDCTIYITYNCAREINHLSILDYDEFMEDLKARNIKLKDEVQNIGKE